MRRIAFRAVPMLATAALLFVGGTSIAEAAKARPAAATVNVTAVDFHFKLSTTSEAKPGTVTFKITNRGHQHHDFKIDGKKTKLLAPGKSTTLTVTLKKGRYFYECTVPGHAQLGMKGYFTVK